MIWTLCRLRRTTMPYTISQFTETEILLLQILFMNCFNITVIFPLELCSWMVLSCRCENQRHLRAWQFQMTSVNANASSPARKFLTSDNINSLKEKNKICFNTCIKDKTNLLVNVTYHLSTKFILGLSCKTEQAKYKRSILATNKQYGSEAIDDKF